MGKVTLCPNCSSWSVEHIKTTDKGVGQKAPIYRIYKCNNCKHKFAERYDVTFVKIENDIK